MPLPIILDTDPGIDDAVAIAAALFEPCLNIKLITTVAGNVSVERTTENALQLLNFWNSSIPIAKGASTPLVRKARNAEDIHGISGMDGFDFKKKHKLKPVVYSACEAIFNTITKCSKPITLVSIGPLTNIALLLNQYPECKSRIEKIVIMGGSSARGNFIPTGEFNITIDPEAASSVFNSGLEIIMCGLDVTHQATLDSEYLKILSNINNTGKMLYSLLKNYRSGSINKSICVHDLCAIAYLIHPEIFDTQKCFVTVETQGVWTSGTTVVDLENFFNRPSNARVALKLDVQKFRQWVSKTLRLAP